MARILTRGLLGVLALVLGVIVAASVLPRGLVPGYAYPPSRPFSGPAWYNPYAGMAGHWYQATLHAHGIDVAFGSNTPDSVVRNYYYRLGYDVPLISDHQRIARYPGLELTDYEHGYSVRKTHQLVIGARHVDWFDILLLQTTDDRQYVLDRLHRQAPIVVVVHPEIRNGYPIRMLRRLTGYDAMEILHEDVSYAPWWDAALSAGRLSWATGSDDAHGIGRPTKMGLAWTMIGAASTGSADLIHALHQGWTYAVSGHEGRIDVRLRSVALHGDTLVVTTDPGARYFMFIGQGGALRSTVRSGSRASYVLRPEDSYIRTVIRTPATTLYLNPVVRYDGHALVRPVAHRASPPPWPYATALLLGLLVYLGVRRAGKGRERTRPADPAEAEPGTRRHGRPQRARSSGTVLSRSRPR